METDRQLAERIWSYMRCEQPLEKADVIIGLGSFYQETVDWCVKLWTDGVAPKILFCGNTGTFSDGDPSPEAVRYAEKAISLGVEKSAILLESDSKNTGENIVLGYNKLQQAGVDVRVAVLVTAPCFLRRVYATAMKQWPAEPKPRFICSAENLTYPEYITRENHQPDIIDIMVGNLGRMRSYAELGYQIDQDIPDDVWSAYEALKKRGYVKYL